MKHLMKCNHCGHTFVAHYKGANCPRHLQRYTGTTFVEDVLEVASDVALVYMAADLSGDILSGVGDLLGGLFD